MQWAEPTVARRRILLSRIGGRPCQNCPVRDDLVVDAFRRAAGDRTHGAAEIEERLIADVLALRPLWTPEGLAEGVRILVDGQPAMASLVVLARRIAAGDHGEVQTFLEHRAAVVRQVPELLAAKATPWIEKAALVVSISRSSAVAAAVEGAWSRGWRGAVVVLDGSGGGRGAEQAGRLGAISQPDATAPRWLDVPDVLVVVGADAVGSDRFVNCVGSRMLLELASARGVPVILVADRAKDVPEETIDAIVGGLPPHRDDFGREWPLFEAVQMSLVTARITD